VSVAIVEWALDNGPASPRMKLALVAIAYAADSDGGSAFPGLAKIAKRAGCSERQAKRLVVQLEEDGWVEVVAYRKGGRGKATEFRVLMERVTPECHPLADGKGDISSGKGDISSGKGDISARERVTSGALKGDISGSAPISPENSMLKPTREPAMRRRSASAEADASAVSMNGHGHISLPESFEEAWSHYPRQIAKQAAKRAYLARCRASGKARASPAELLRATVNFAEAMRLERREQQVIMHGATFYGPDERWKDYLEPPKAAVPAWVAEVDEFFDGLEAANGP
jgi:Helix-turn-helix domain